MGCRKLLHFGTFQNFLHRRWLSRRCDTVEPAKICESNYLLLKHKMTIILCTIAISYPHILSFDILTSVMSSPLYILITVVVVRNGLIGLPCWPKPAVTVLSHSILSVCFVVVSCFIVLIFLFDCNGVLPPTAYVLSLVGVSPLLFVGSLVGWLSFTYSWPLFVVPFSSKFLQFVRIPFFVSVSVAVPNLWVFRVLPSLSPSLIALNAV